MGTHGVNSTTNKIVHKKGNQIKDSCGVQVDLKDDDIKLAFEFFGGDDGKLSPSAMRRVFSALNRNLSTKELTLLFDGKESISIQEVMNLLKDHSTEIDPVAEAFSILDPTNTGFIVEERMKKIFKNLGYGNLTDEELAVLVEAGDSDGDGRLGIEDFRNLSRPEDISDPVLTSRSPSPVKLTPKKAKTKTKKKSKGRKIES